MAHVAEYKKRIVNDLAKLMTDYPVIAAVSVENIPALQLQKVRAQIRDNVVVMMTKRRLINIALDKAKESKKGIEKLKDHLAGMPALMFTKENPFKLAAMLIKSKSNAPAKAGQTAPNDIIIEAGPTSFAPGPVIGELGQLGIKTKVEDGKIAIKEDIVLVKKGEEVSEKAAAMLIRLGIEPMEIGLMPEAAYDNGIIYTRDVLEVDEKEYINKLKTADSEAFNLACEIKYPAKEVVEMLIAKAFNEAKAIGIEFKIIDKEIIDSLLGIAETEMLSLKESAGIKAEEKKAKEEKPAGKVKEEKKEFAEKKKEEAKVEEKPAEGAAKAEEKTEEVAEEKKAEPEKEEVKEGPKEKKKEEPAKEELKEEIEGETEKGEKKDIEEEKPAEEPKKETLEIKAEKVNDEKKEEVDKKIEEMVKKTKDFVEGNIPSAEKLVDEAEDKEKSEEPEKKGVSEEKEKAKKTPSAHDLAKEKETAHLDAKKKKDEKEIQDIQEIVKKLQKGEKL